MPRTRHSSASPHQIAAAGPLRAWLYARVSTEAQAEKETSIPAQLAACRAYVKTQGWIVAGASEDRGITGSTTDRPGLQESLSAARRGEFDVLLVHKLDRLSRSPGDTFAIKALLADSGAKVASATETFVGSAHPMDEAMEGMAATFARLYVANLRAEVHKGLRQIAAPNEAVQAVGPDYDGPGAGRMGGLPPYGYRLVQPEIIGSGWAIDAEAAAWVDFIYCKLLEGQTPAGICRALNALGVPPPSVRTGRGGRRRSFATSHAEAPAKTEPAGPCTWYPQVVQKILMQRAYRGQVHYQGNWYPGSHPPIIAAPVWMRVQEILDSRGPGRAEESRAILSGGLLRCPLCHAEGRVSPLYSVQAGTLGPDGRRPFHYRCGLHFIKNARRRVGGVASSPDAQAACAGYNLSESKVLPLLVTYLSECAAQMTPEELLRTIQEASTQESSGKGNLSAANLTDTLGGAGNLAKRKHADERKRSLEAEVATLPAMRQRYQQLAARDLMTEDELAEQLTELAVRGREIAEMLAREEQAERATPSQMPALDAFLLLQMLMDPDVTPLQKRDRLRSVFSYIVPNADKHGLEVYFL